VLTPGARGSSGWAAGAGRVAPLQTKISAVRRPDFKERSAGRPRKGARSQTGGRSRNGAWGNWASPSALRSTGAAGAACGQGGNASGCKPLLASANVPGPARSGSCERCMEEVKDALQGDRSSESGVIGRRSEVPAGQCQVMPTRGRANLRHAGTLAQHRWTSACQSSRR
jgi:hypothetical protein